MAIQRKAIQGDLGKVPTISFVNAGSSEVTKSTTLIYKPK